MRTRAARHAPNAFPIRVERERSPSDTAAMMLETSAHASNPSLARHLDPGKGLHLLEEYPWLLEKP